MSTLVILNGKFRGQGCDLESFRGLDRITIGRTEDNTFQIPDDSISGAHCELLLSANGVAVRDLESRNGTFIDGKAVQAGALLPGQVLRLGHVEIRLEADSPAQRSVRAGAQKANSSPAQRSVRAGAQKANSYQ
jgi:pSer/pThr/pTyr-binding forkhead associated (FHA) protein